MVSPGARVILMLLLMPACFCSGQTQSDSQAGIEGVITMAPIHPGPVQDGSSGSGPLANTSLVVQNEKGMVTSFVTDDQGRFRVSLEPGHYTVSMKEKNRGIGGFGPFNVEVVAGKMTKVEWRRDTRMR